MFFFAWIYLLFTLFTTTTTATPYNIVFLRGSFVSKLFYTPFIHSLQKKLLDKKIESTIEFGDYFPLQNYKNNTILLSHSFGGSFALLHCLADNTNCIRGCVLINSHFNQRNKMPYPGFILRSIKQSVFTILNNCDEKLPLAKSIDDLQVKIKENLTNKFFVINNGTHFSTFQNYEEVDHATNQILSYIEGLDKQDFESIEKITETAITEHNVTTEEPDVSKEPEAKEEPDGSILQ